MVRVRIAKPREVRALVQGGLCAYRTTSNPRRPSFRPSNPLRHKGEGMSKLTMDHELADLLRASRVKIAAMSPAEYAAMIEAQRQSFARAMAPCEHGIVDWETCPDCRAAIRNRGAQP